MAEPTERLIAQLSAKLRPVERLRPPLARALGWLALMGVVGTALVYAFSSHETFAHRVVDMRLGVELLSTLLTGILAVIAAFYLSLPDRSRLWALLPWPAFGLWLATSGYSCYRQWLITGRNGLQIGESAHCLGFILAASLPMAIFLYRILGRAATLTPLSVAFTGALGIAGLAAFLLQFFHPFDVTLIDLSLHLLAVVLVVLAGSLLARPALARQPPTST